MKIHHDKAQYGLAVGNKCNTMMLYVGILLGAGESFLIVLVKYIYTHNVIFILSLLL